MKIPNMRPIPLRLLLPLVFCVATSLGSEIENGAKLEREILDNLIAPCCWLQPVSQHYSEVAEQIRKEVHAMVAAGKSREEIFDHFVARYGERILAAPRAKGFNTLAYILPWAALILGVCLLVLVIKKRLPKMPATLSAARPMDQRYTSMVEKEIQDLNQ